MMRAEDKEAGCADDAAILAVPAEMSAHIDAVLADARVNRAFARVPVMFGLIDVDATMCAHATLAGDTLEAMSAAWQGGLDDPALVRTCLPLEARDAGDVRASFDGRTLSVSADDGELCWLHSALQSGAGASDVAGPGTIGATLQLQVGRAPALLHAVRLNGRLLLVEGRHRARVLRAAGETYLPCLISNCADLDDVREAAPAVTALDLERLFDAPRPPMLRDFGRAELVYRYEARRLRRLLQLRIEATAQWVP
jgi:hypothetical protein